MAGFGERLRREREMRGITLDAIAASTKIGTRALKALEEEDFDKLPGGIFNKGFVRAYARFLGIEEEQAVAEYMTAAGEPVHEDPLDSERLAKLGANWKPPQLDMSDREPAHFPWAFLVVVVLIAAVGVGGWKLYQRRKPQKPRADVVLAQLPAPATSEATSSAPQTTSQPMVSTPPLSPVAVAPAPATEAPKTTPHPTPGQVAAVASEPPPANPAPPAATPAPLTVRIHARQDCWVDVIADGKHIVNTTLKPDKELTIPARQEVILEAGNAAGIDVWLNDKQEPPLGGPGKYAKRIFTADAAR